MSFRLDVFFILRKRKEWKDVFDETERQPSHENAKPGEPRPDLGDLRDLPGRLPRAMRGGEIGPAGQGNALPPALWQGDGGIREGLPRGLLAF